MIKNYFKTTIRSLRKNRLFSIINIFGLSVGLAAAMFILQYAFQELSYDKFHEDSHRIYRVMNERFEGEKLIQRGQITYSAVGKQMHEDFPEVESYFTLSGMGQMVYRWEEHLIQVPFTIMVEPNFYDIFSFKLIAGNPRDLFDQRNKVVLAESMAKKLLAYNGSDWSQYLGTQIKMGSAQTELELVGIIEDAPRNSSLQYEVIISRASTFDWWRDAEFSWQGSDYFHYLLLNEGSDHKALEQKFDAFSDRYFKGDEVTGTFERFHLQPLEDVYLKSDYEYENHQTASGRMVQVLILIAVFILLMAWVNYVNLTTSRSLQRAKEVGVRKVVGATRKQLIGQFLTESFVLNMLALILAITFIQILQGFFNQLVGKELSLIDFLSQKLFWGVPVFAMLMAVLVLGAILSGLYPAFVLSGFRPSESLKGEFSKSGKGRLLRRALVTFQFALSTALIAGTFLVYKQTSFMRSQDLGMNMEQVLTVEGPSTTQMDTTFVEHIYQFINKLEQNPKVLKAGTSTRVFGQRLSRVFNVRRAPEDEGQMLNRIDANFGFLDVYGVDMLSGRNFRPSDHNRDFNLIESAIVNEKAARLMGFESVDAALNQRLLFFGKEWRIVGVTRDFHHRSLQQSIEPLLILPLYNGGDDTYHIKVEASNIKETISYIEKTYDEFFPGDLFQYNFMDTRFNNQYKADEQFGKIFNLFSILAIAIACLGLFGLAGYTAIQRTKEIGIRKVLGASINDILRLLSKDFMGLIIIANVIGLPLIYLGAREWLSGYAYQTAIGWSFFLIPVLVVMAVAILIIISQTIKTAKSNPVNALRQD